MINAHDSEQDDDLVTRAYYEAHLARGRFKMLAHGKGSPASFSEVHKNSEWVQSITLTKTGSDKILTFTFKKDIPLGSYLNYDFDVDQTNGANGMDIMMYGGCKGAVYTSKTTYQVSAKNSNNNGKEFSVGTTSGAAKRFLKAWGKM